MHLSLLVQDLVPRFGVAFTSLNFWSPAEQHSRCIFLAIAKSPNIWACAITIQTGTRDGALNMLEDCFLKMENTQSEHSIFCQSRQKLGEPLKCIPHKAQAGSSYMWLCYDRQNHFIPNCTLPRRAREANGTQEKCFLEEDGWMHHTTTAIVVASN